MITAKMVDKEISKAVNSATRANATIHAASMLALRFAHEQNGAGLDKLSSLFERLFKAGAKQHMTKLVAWTETYFPVSVSRSDKTGYRIGLKNKFDPASFKFDDADATPFYKLKGANDDGTKTFDLEQLLKMVNRALGARAQAAKSGSEIVGNTAIFDFAERQLAAVVKEIEVRVKATAPAEDLDAEVDEVADLSRNMTAEQIVALQSKLQAELLARTPAQNQIAA